MTVGLTAIAGCSPDEPSGKPTDTSTDLPGITQAQIDEAMNTPTTLDYWAWVSDLQNQVDLFTAKYPAMTVNLVNNGDSAKQIDKLRAALQSNRDVPDVVQLGYDYLPGFLQTDSLLDLTPYGAAELKPLFTAGTWGQVALNGGIWAIPQDSGPMGMLYRTDLFKQAGVEAPKTWDDFAVAAKAIHDATGGCIANLPGNDWPMMIALFDQAGAKPFDFDGAETLTINIDSPQAQKVVKFWQELIQKDLVCVTPDFTDDWYQGLARGQYASWITAAWGPMFLEGVAADTSGNWAATDMPQWNAGERVSANWGGSTNAVVKASDTPIQAYMLAKFINSDPESTLKLANEQSLFPVTVATLEDPAFTNYVSEFFGGQRVNETFADIALTVSTNTRHTPIGDFLNQSQNDTLGKAIAEKGDMVAGLTAWQEAVVAYAQQQGFTVK